MDNGKCCDLHHSRFFIFKNPFSYRFWSVRAYFGENEKKGVKYIKTKQLWIVANDTNPEEIGTERGQYKVFSSSPREVEDDPTYNPSPLQPRPTLFSEGRDAVGMAAQQKTFCFSMEQHPGRLLNRRLLPS